MSESFRLSPESTRGVIPWREWGASAFDDALRLDRPILLNLTATWCQWCRLMDETTYADAALAAELADAVVPIRVDADCFPHVQDRYIAGGWPTNAFLTPTGEVLWAGTYVAPDEFRSVMSAVLGAWRDRREELRGEIERRRRAMQAARSRQPTGGLVRREAADDVLAATRDAFDAQNGGFGSEPKFPNPEAIEPLFVHSERSRDPEWATMAERTLDGMLAGELWDEIDGGFFRYAQGADWTSPRREKLLETNAGLLRAYALGAALRGRGDWAAVAERIVDWADSTLAAGELWYGSQTADEDYFSADAGTRAARTAPPADNTVHTSRNAQWIRALAEAGGRLRRPEWTARAARALDALLERMAAPDGLLFHFQRAGEAPQLPGLLIDLVESAQASLAVAQATGDAAYVAHARRLTEAMQLRLWGDDGGFYDHIPATAELGALRYRDRPFEPNAAAARLYSDLALLTGERGYRAVAERVLALLSPLAGRYGVAGTGFALAVEEFFDAPPRVVLVGSADATAELRAAALALPRADLRVWSLEAGGRIGGTMFPAAAGAVAYVCGASSCSAPLHDGAAVERAALVAH